MAKTDLTKRIEKALEAWFPTQFAEKKVDTFRKGFGATEVPVENGTVCNGLIDYVRVQECYIQKHENKEGEFFQKEKQYVIDVVIVCVEIKISLSDFLSKHGHNFVGNTNYYAIPADLYSQVKDKIPPDIGILLYYDGLNYHGIRKKKEAKLKQLSSEQQKWLILSASKRNIKCLTEKVRDLEQHILETETPCW